MAEKQGGEKESPKSISFQIGFAKKVDDKKTKGVAAPISLFKDAVDESEDAESLAAARKMGANVRTGVTRNAGLKPFFRHYGVVQEAGGSKTHHLHKPQSSYFSDRVAEMQKQESAQSLASNVQQEEMASDIGKSKSATV